MSTSSSKSSMTEKPSHDYDNYSKIHSFIGLRGEKLNLAVSVLSGVGFLLFGYDQGVMGSLLTLPSFRETFRQIDVTTHPENSVLQGAVIALYEIGCMISALSTMYFGDKLGRRKLIFIGSVIMLIGGVIQSCAYTVAHLTVARIITGFGNGFITATVPIWQAELAKPKMRGKLIMLQGSIIALGITISYWVDFAFYFLDKPGASYASVSWRFPIAFQCIFPIIIIPFIFKLPESPRWLLKKERREEARIVFSAIYEVPLDDHLVHASIEEIEQSIAMEVREGADKFNFKSLLSQGESKNFQRTMIAAWSQIMQQITGINLITYYAGTIFEQYIGMPPLQSRILAACNGTEYFLASLLAFWTIERFGRRKLMLFGAAGQAISMAILTGCNHKADPTNSGNSVDHKAGIAAAVFLFVFNSFFGCTWLGISWLLPPEILPLGIRAPATGISTACNWGFNFMVVMITPVAFSNIGAYTYSIFAVINFLMIPAVYFFFPETAGRSLEEMDIIFAQTPANQPWKSVSIARSLPYMHAGANNNEDIENKRHAFAEHRENISIEEGSGNIPPLLEPNEDTGKAH
ncbi:sugar transporter Stl1p [[Candida] railenensis]|uniref:Sugar transporter Stl1p n=1 Tax=[Candida] railenensis TaxID=45579 RepID=A0A9P0QL95_9ASCO|nr:sugar transporter Stl1p [[Candida] railenensis]